MNENTAKKLPTLEEAMMARLALPEIEEVEIPGVCVVHVKRVKFGVLAAAIQKVKSKAPGAGQIMATVVNPDGSPMFTSEDQIETLDPALGYALLEATNKVVSIRSKQEEAAKN